MSKKLIATLEDSVIISLINTAIEAGKSVAPDQDHQRMYAEAWLRGWCYEKTTRSFEEALVIFLYNHITKN